MNKILPFIIISLYCFISQQPLFAQTKDSSGNWTLSAYADAYYAQYTDDVGQGNFQKFPTVSPRNNSIGLNVFQLSSQYSGTNVRAAATLQFGDIPSSAWSQKYNAIQEAHIGIKICKILWLDAGFFKTHFGTENLMPKDNICSSVSVNTYYEPYYESGLRLNFDPTKNLEINLFLLNGYGIYEDNNKKKSAGLGITYVINDKTGIGYTSYLGDDYPDGTRLPHTRIDNNIFYNYSGSRFEVQAGGDLCFQQHSDLATGLKMASMFGAITTIRYRVKNNVYIYGRGEIFNDPDALMGDSIPLQKTGYRLWGITAGLEYKPTVNSYIRLEGRKLQMDSKQPIFHFNGQNLTYRYEIMLNMGFWFDIVKGTENKK